MSNKRFYVSMNLSQVLIFLGACYYERAKVGVQSIATLWKNLTTTQLNWIWDKGLIPVGAVPAHKCYRGNVPYSQQVEHTRCPMCQFRNKPMAEQKKILEPWLPNIAHNLAERLRTGSMRGGETYINFKDPILSKPLYKKPVRVKKVVAKKSAAKKTIAKTAHKVRESRGNRDPDFY